MDKKYVFLDIDGTIYHHYIPASAITAIQRAKANGHKMYICTGRPIGLVPKEVVDIIEYEGKICASGCYIELENKLFLDHFFDPSLTKRILKKIEKYPVGYSLDTNQTIFFNANAEVAIQAFETNIVPYDQSKISDDSCYKAMPFDLSKDIPEVSKIAIYTSNADYIQAIRTDLGDLVYMTEDMMIYGVHYVEISPKKISKESALKYLVECHKIPYEETICIGDSMNDYESIKYAKIGVVMGNGDPRLKEIADYITDTLHNDGLYKAFQYLKLI